nr:PREDICTED: sorting nexin-13-like [Bemisia tabaci]
MSFGKKLGWLGLTAALCVSTFGAFYCFLVLLGAILFVVGALGMTYIFVEEKMDSYSKRQYSTSYSSNGALFPIEGCDQELLESFKKKSPRRSNKPITGQFVIDKELDDIISLVMRDYVHSWYDNISTDSEFPAALRLCINRTLTRIASRVSEIDWTPYFTARLVDDAASHLRLFRQARTKMKTKYHDTCKCPELESIFFDLELMMEQNQVCRDHICLDEQSEKGYLQQVSEKILELFAPEEDYNCQTVRLLTREILVNAVLLPLVSKLSDPDFINQIVVFVCKRFPVSSDNFLTILRTTDNIDELHATKEMLTKEIADLKSCEADGEAGYVLRNVLNNLMYRDRTIDERVSQLQKEQLCVPELPSSHSEVPKLSANPRMFSLPLDVILKNNVALTYFIDYMSSIGAGSYLFFLLNIEGWRTSAEQQLSDIKLIKMVQLNNAEIGQDLSGTEATSDLKSETVSQDEEQICNHIREAASSIFTQFLSESASTKLKIDPVLVEQLWAKICSQPPDETWFDNVQAAILKELQTDENYLNGFRGSQSYIKLLSDLELFHHKEEDLLSSDSTSLSDNTSVASLPFDSIKEFGPDDFLMVQSDDSLSTSSVPSRINRSADFILQAEIVETGVAQGKGKTFGIYDVSVVKCYQTIGEQENWHVFRRYSDFYELHKKVTSNFHDLGKLTFPSKKAFHNIDRSVLEKRMRMLNSYLKILLQPKLLASRQQLKVLLLEFFEQGAYDRRVTDSNLTRTLDTVMVPFKESMKTMGQAVKTVPDNLMVRVDGFVDNISRVFSTNGPDANCEEATKVGALLDLESDENIPLRILLLLMTEIFELKSRNQWLRRRFVILLRQILRTMLGDVVNKKIVDFVSTLLDPQQIAEYLRTLKESWWPNDKKRRPSPPRDDAAKMRTRVSAKAALLASLSDEFKHLLGSETSRQGIMLVFSSFQEPVLNRRLVYVLLEGLLITLLPSMSGIFTQIHASSPRVIKTHKMNKVSR